MPQKSRKEKQLAALRREVELLRSQVKGAQQASSVETAKEEVVMVKEKKAPLQMIDEAIPIENFKYLGADLRKTGILTALCLATITILYLTQARWAELT